MKIKDIFAEKKVVFSLEIFPPKYDMHIETIYKVLDKFKKIEPDYMSVTYGAGGGVNNNKTCEISSLLKEKYGVEPLAHLTCINSTQENIDDILERLKANKIENILALRGDKPLDGSQTGNYNYAYQLIDYIKKKGDFGVAAASYPEGHLETENLAEDIEYLKHKVDYGVDYLITQMFFDNQIFYNFISQIRKKGIDIPIEAGIMPVINKKQVGRIIELSDAYFPEKFKKILVKYQDNPEALRDAGIAYAVEQIVDLISSDVDGIHLYTMNNPFVARKIKEAIESLLKHINHKKVG
ncbi:MULTISPECIES: methylenetetrahydrofolate reductase [NAD(P)H] [unclassified Halanaerobium]|uniref:methylenetetrahydrofolate reductase [NAD(P)H] n=1 Tax=unclassified Halanaerobium TaxID=2641197 RepID=UPI000DF2DB0A|nr:MULTISPECIES: methylenetetrahydrofolate reductase [NAD(P)H] [unclassified Halanaerobium]RCW47738.1 5,10-methylenetetrahydrofolate reductase (NAD(P)) [Halanaerobium sp. MA284_MarDTE_T2]RCW81775.1 5,10-methylenetetrahydrofolate reductase (NAD(P)) [Halanaerobium sp. DL-01]